MNSDKTLEHIDLQSRLDRIEQKIDILLRPALDIEIPETLDVYDVASLCKVSPRSVYNWVYLGKIPSFKAHGRLLFRKEDLHKFLKAKNKDSHP